MCHVICVYGTCLVVFLYLTFFLFISASEATERETSETTSQQPTPAGEWSLVVGVLERYVGKMCLKHVSCSLILSLSIVHQQTTPVPSCAGGSLVAQSSTTTSETTPTQQSTEHTLGRTTTVYMCTRY